MTLGVGYSCFCEVRYFQRVGRLADMRMTTREELEKLLELYLEKVLPAMLRRQYHLRLVKGGPDYPHLSEQSHLTHIING